MAANMEKVVTTKTIIDEHTKDLDDEEDVDQLEMARWP